MLGRLLLLIVFVPLVELGLLVELTKLTSLWVTIAVVLTTATVGLSLVKWQGLNTWKEIQRQLAAGESPSRSIVSGVLILVAGAMLLAPGLLTDTIGFLLLIPSVRSVITTRLQKRFLNSVSTSFRSSVWVNAVPPASMSGSNAAPHESQRPQVRVIDPHEPRIGD